MSNIVYNYFDTYNHTGTLATSSYALPFAEFTFIPRLTDAIASQVLDSRIIWNLGDGTVLESLTAKHNYKLPGNYKVSYRLFDNSGASSSNIFYQVVDVYDFVPCNITISVADTDSFVLTASRINSSIYVTNSLSYHVLSSVTDNKTIIPFCSGCSNDYFYTGLDSKPYGHLYPSSSFYQLKISDNNTAEFIEIPDFKTITTPLYCKLSSNTIVFTSETDTAAFFCGLTGYANIYFKSDTPTNRLNLLFGYEAGELEDYTNTSTVGLCAKVVPNTGFDRISINSNGVTSEGNTTDVFPIAKNKFSNTKIGFVAKIKDSFNFTNKTADIGFAPQTLDTLFSSTLITQDYYEITTQIPLKLVLTDGIKTFSNVAFYTNYKELEYLQYGFVKGYFIADLPLTTNVFISAVYIDQKNGGRLITGISNMFNIYPKNYYNIARGGEDIDMTQQFKDIAIQPLFLDKNVLFNDFLGSMVGNLSSSIGSTLGKRTYEKIQNFVDNTNTLDYANIQGVIGMTQFTGNTNMQFDKSNYQQPTEMGRLIDLLSINFNRLRGASDNFNQDFKTFGYQDRETYGKNLGVEVSTLSYTVTAGKNLVAFERFSGKFTTLDTSIPLLASNIATSTQADSMCYTLSSYNNTWGWGLVLPVDYSVNDIINNYFFYEHVDVKTNVKENSVINYNDVTSSLNTSLTSYTEWSEPEGIIANMLSNQLYTGLNLFN